MQNVIITNKKSKFLFSIEKQNIKEDILDAKTLYDNYGSQWFESSAEKYHKLLDVNPDLQDKINVKNQDYCILLGERLWSFLTKTMVICVGVIYY